MVVKKSPNAFLALLSLYVAVLVLFDLSGKEAVKTAANAFAAALVLASLLVSVTRLRRSLVTETTLYWAMVGLAVLGLVVTLPGSSAVDSLKITGVFALYFLGAHVRDVDRAAMCSRKLAFVLLLIPIGYTVARCIVSGEPLASVSNAVFVNRNNAILFVVVSTLALHAAGVTARSLVALVLVAALLFSTLGAILASFGALVLSYGRKARAGSVAAAVLALPVLWFIAEKVGAYDRLDIAWQATVGVIGRYGLDVTSNLTYGEITQITGTTDVSLLFRIRHWADLIDIYVGSDISSILVGLGPGSSAVLSQHGLLPHNDYLRILFEFGLLYFVLFMAFLFHVHRTLPKGMPRFVFYFVLIYMFSDNLLNNFSAMAVLLFFAGFVRVGRATPRLTHHPAKAIRPEQGLVSR